MTLFNTLADSVLGPRVPDSELPHPVPPDVVVRRNRLVPAIGGLLMGSRRPAGAVTLGRTILWNADTPVTDDLIVHELVHVEQWRADPLFALRYCAEWLRHGYRENPFEKVAYARQREYAAQKPKSASARPS